MNYKILENKKGVILGLANKRSIAWGIAKELKAHGAELAFSYLNESIQTRVTPLAEELDSKLVFKCDVNDSDSILDFFNNIKQHWGNIDFVVHSIAFANKDTFHKKYIMTNKEDFINAMLISAYSFTEIMKVASDIMNENGTALTLSYEGSNFVMPSYNLMGVCKAALESSVRYLSQDLGNKNIRVNSLSAGPIKTLAASAIDEFKHIIEATKDKSPLQRSTTIEDVGRTAVYLLSELSSGVTGNNIVVDCGANIVGINSQNNN